MFAKRLISAVVILAVAGGLLLFGGGPLMVLNVLVALAGVYELMKVDHMEKTLPGCMCYISVIGFYLNLFFLGEDFILPWMAAVILLILSAYVVTFPKYHIRSISLCFFAVMYVSVLLSYFYQTRSLPGGNWFVWLIVLGASGSDTFAYLTGMLIGKHHFSELSPKKTIEGCLGGVVGAGLLCLLYSLFVPAYIVEKVQGNIYVLFLMIGLISSLISQIGDLAASAIKRNYEIKDYSDLIPGHGGILDRFDSLLFVAPLVYYILIWFVL